MTTPENYHIRIATPADAAAACEVVRQSIEHLCIADHHNDPTALAAWLANKTASNFENWISSPANVAVVAEGATGIVGSGLLRRGNHLALLYVSPSARFSGVSKGMLARLEEEARSQGVADITLTSTQTALKFYKRCGYVEAGEPSTSFGVIKAYPMAKQLVLYRPFIDDPAHLSLVEGECYVVLRATDGLYDAFAQVQQQMKERLSGLEVSYPAQPHVTVAGLAKGTTVDRVRELVSDWAEQVPPLRLEIERLTVFPAPFQIPIMQIRKTPELSRAMTSLRAEATQRGLTDLAAIEAADWIFHMSIAYCSSLTGSEWSAIEQWIDTLAAPTAQTVASEAEIAVFGGGRESSGGAFVFRGAP